MSLQASLQASAVVPTCRRPDLLDRCLAALVAQDMAPAAYEIVVADDAASDQTRRQVERWAERAGATGRTIRYLRVAGRHGPAAARNTGWRAARGAAIAFTDDDCLPDRGWLRAGLAALAAGADAAYGAVEVPMRPLPTDYEHNAAHLADAGFVTANCFCRRAALARVGGFDERFTQAWREDSDLYFALLERRARVVRAPGARVVHPVRPARWGVSLGQQRKSAFNALLYKKHPALYATHIQAHPPWRYYATVAALLGAAGGVLVRRRGMALVAGSLWMALTAQFCAMRLRQTSRAPRHAAEMIATSALIPPLAVFWRLRGAARYRVRFW